MSKYTGAIGHPTFVTHDMNAKAMAQRHGKTYVRVTRSFLNSHVADPAQLIRLSTTSMEAHPPGKFTAKVNLGQHCIPRSAGIDARREAAQMLLDLLRAANPGVQLYVKYGMGF